MSIFDQPPPPSARLSWKDFRGIFFALALVGVLKGVVPADAADRFLVYGDSISAEGVSNGTDWASLLAAQRPDLGALCRSAVPNRTTTQAIANTTSGLGFTFAFCSAWGTLDVGDVYVALGTNDLCTLTAQQSATNLMTLAAMVEGWGATPHILTPTPALSNINCLGTDWNVYVRDVSEWLFMLNGVGPWSYDVVNVRDEFTGLDWRDCASDGVHPSGTAGLPCRQAMADEAALH